MMQAPHEAHWGYFGIIAKARLIKGLHCVFITYGYSRGKKNIN